MVKLQRNIYIAQPLITGYRLSMVKLQHTACVSLFRYACGLPLEHGKVATRIRKGKEDNLYWMLPLEHGKVATLGMPSAYQNQHVGYRLSMVKLQLKMQECHYTTKVSYRLSMVKLQLENRQRFHD